jgi:hypothetical protein
MMKKVLLKMAWNGCKQVLPWLMYEENSWIKGCYRWRMLVKISSRCCMNVVFGKAKFFLWKFLDCFEKCQMMQFLE